MMKKAVAFVLCLALAMSFSLSAFAIGTYSNPVPFEATHQKTNSVRDSYLHSSHITTGNCIQLTTTSGCDFYMYISTVETLTGNVKENGKLKNKTLGITYDISMLESGKYIEQNPVYLISVGCMVKADSTKPVTINSSQFECIDPGIVKIGIPSNTFDSIKVYPGQTDYLLLAFAVESRYPDATPTTLCLDESWYFSLTPTLVDE